MIRAEKPVLSIAVPARNRPEPLERSFGAVLRATAAFVAATAGRVGGPDPPDLR